MNDDQQTHDDARLEFAARIARQNALAACSRLAEAEETGRLIRETVFEGEVA